MCCGQLLGIEYRFDETYEVQLPLPQYGPVQPQYPYFEQHAPFAQGELAEQVLLPTKATLLQPLTSFPEPLSENEYAGVARMRVETKGKTQNVEIMTSACNDHKLLRRFSM